MKNKQQSKRRFGWLILVATVVALLTTVLVVHTFATGETGEEATTPSWGSVSLSLDENFDLRFYLKNAEPADVSVSFERNGQVIEDVTPKTSDNGTYYAYTGITPQFFSDEITATLTYTDDEGKLQTEECTESVESYCEKVKNSTSDEYTAAKAVVAAILAYGEAAKKYVAPTGAVTDVPDGDAVKVLYPTAVKGTDIRSAQLVLGNDIRMAFLLSDATATGTAAVTVGNSQTTLTVSGGKIILPMKAADLLKKVTVVYEGSTVTYSVAQYAKNKLTDADSSNELKLLVARIYEYALAVHTYAGNTDDLIHVNVFEKATTEGGADVIRRSCAVCDQTLGEFGIMQKNTFDTTATNTTESGVKADGNNRYYRLSKTDASKTNENRAFNINIALPDYLVFEIDIFLQRGDLTVSSDTTPDTWFGVDFGYKFTRNGGDLFSSGSLSVKGDEIYINGVATGKDAKADTWYNVRTIYVKSEKQFYLYLNNEFVGTAATGNDPLLAEASLVKYPNVSVGKKNQKGPVTYIDNVTFYTSGTEHTSHTWDNGKIMTNYTDTADGDLVLTCKTCGETEHAVAHRLAFACAGEKMNVSCLNCQETLASLSAPTSTNKFQGTATVTKDTEKTKNGIMEVDGKKFQNLLDTKDNDNTPVSVNKAGANAADYSVLRFDFQLKESDIQKRKKEGTEWVNDGDPTTVNSSVYFVFFTYQTEALDKKFRGRGDSFRIYINDDGKLAVKNSNSKVEIASDINGKIDTWYTLVCGYSKLQNRFYVSLNDGGTDHFVGAFDCSNTNLPTEYNYFGYINVFLGNANQIGERAWVDNMYIWLADDAK